MEDEIQPPAASDFSESNPNFSPRAQEDFDLVRRAIDVNDQSAYAKLMARYRDSIYFMVLKMVHDPDDADDLTIEAFGKAFSNLEKYSPDYAFSTWLYKIALNNSIDFIRRKRMETFSIDEENETESGDSIKMDLQSPNLDPEEKYIKEQRALLMREVLEKINPKYRMLIELRFFDELSYEEIADKTRLPLGTVKAQLFRAKDLLYQILSPSRSRY
ncbi:MAG TPA: sigma-70 family RNA polymerase sigma factor [Chitinophagales bacterium]|nr:sigma-70 family RNA polymerase sigma factor [Chitinophagales bacterium]